MKLLTKVGIGLGTQSPQCGLDVASGVSFRRTPISSNYTILPTDTLIGVTSTAAARTVTLPAASAFGNGQFVTVVDESGGAGTNNITIARNSTPGTDTINGLTSFVLNKNSLAATFYSNGSNAWFTTINPTSSNGTQGFQGVSGQVASYTSSFTSANLVSSVLTVNHNLSQTLVTVSVYNNSNRLVIPNQVTLTNANSCTVDLSGYTVSGTWNVIAISSGTMGPQGAQGLPGAQGAGSAGAQGFQGNMGNQGYQGFQGNQGTQGVTGSGTQGNQGYQGYQGNIGNQGVTGVGTQGNQGVTGNNSTPGGPNKSLQYNNNGAFTGDSNLSWNASSKSLSIGTDDPGISNYGNGTLVLYAASDARFDFVTASGTMLIGKVSGNWFGSNSPFVFQSTTGDIVFTPVINEPTRGVVVTAANNGKVGIGTTTPGAKLHIKGTSPDVCQFVISGATSQNLKLVVLQQVSSTGIDQNVSSIDGGWTNSTDSIRTGFVEISASDFTGVDKKGLRIESDGTQSKLGFYGGTAVAKPSGSIVSALGSLGLVSSPTITTADLGTGTANNTTYLRGDGTWATPAGGGGGSLAIGSPVTGGTPSCVLFVDSSSNLGQSSTFNYNPTTSKVGIGVTSPSALLEMQTVETIGTTAGSTLPILTLRGLDGNNDQFKVYLNRFADGNSWYGAEYVMGRTVDNSIIAQIRFSNSGILFDTKSIFNSNINIADRNGGSTSAIEFPPYGETFVSSGSNRYGMGETAGQLVLSTQTADMHFYTYFNNYGFRYFVNHGREIAYLDNSGLAFRANSSTTDGRYTAKISQGFSDANDSTSKGYISLSANDWTGTYREGVKVGSDGTQPMLGFYGASTVVKPSGSIVSALGSLGLVSSPSITTADLGTGTANNTTYLRGDGTWSPATATIAIGSPVTGYSANSILTTNSSGNLAQSSTTVISSGKLGIGNATPSAFLDIRGPTPLGGNVGDKIEALTLRVTNPNDAQFQIFQSRHSNSPGLEGFGGTEWVLRTVIDSSPFSVMRMGQYGFNSYVAFDTNVVYTQSSQIQLTDRANGGQPAISFSASGATETFLSSGSNRYGNGEIQGQLSLWTQNGYMHFGCYGFGGFKYFTNNTTLLHQIDQSGRVDQYITADEYLAFLNSGTTASTQRLFAYLSGGFTDKTDATRKPYYKLTLRDYAGDREMFNFQADGTQGKIGFNGATPVAKPVVTGSWSDGTAGASLAAALASLGLITNNTTP